MAGEIDRQTQQGEDDANQVKNGYQNAAQDASDAGRGIHDAAKNHKNSRNSEKNGKQGGKGGKPGGAGRHGIPGGMNAGANGTGAGAGANAAGKQAGRQAGKAAAGAGKEAGKAAGKGIKKAAKAAGKAAVKAAKHSIKAAVKLLISLIGPFIAVFIMIVVVIIVIFFAFVPSYQVAAVNLETTSSSTYGGSGGGYAAASDAQGIWNVLVNDWGLTEAGAAGVMGNMRRESNLTPCTLEIQYANKSGMTSQQYADAVDNGTYSNFVNDAYGWGLVQFTYWAVKQHLLDVAQREGKSIADGGVQLEAIHEEIQNKVSGLNYNNLYTQLKSVTDPKEAAWIWYTTYEMPGMPRGTASEPDREKYAQEIYDTYKGTAKNSTESVNGL